MQHDETPDKDSPEEPWASAEMAIREASGPSDAEIVDNHRLDNLYTHAFKNGAGKFFVVVSADQEGTPEVVEADQELWECTPIAVDDWQYFNRRSAVSSCTRAHVEFPTAGLAR